MVSQWARLGLPSRPAAGGGRTDLVTASSEEMNEAIVYLVQRRFQTEEMFSMTITPPPWNIFNESTNRDIGTGFPLVL